MILVPVDSSCIVLGYIGPGAGFAFMGSFLVLLAAIVLVVLAVATWPFRAILGLVLRRGRRRAPTDVGRVVIVGLDGLDPARCARLIAAGKLPHLADLARNGAFRPLASTCPPISPVAWSSFMTGVNPGKHRIFDFLSRDLRTYLPELSSVRIDAARPGRRAKLKLLRKSRPFWAVLGEHGVFSTVLRVPVTFPPEEFHGLCLSGMCVPDLRGTQGTFTCFTSDAGSAAGAPTGGDLRRIEFRDGRAEMLLPGPPSTCRDGGEVGARLLVRLSADGLGAVLRVARQRVELRAGVYSPWVRVPFRVGRFRHAYGICRFLLVATTPAFLLYVTPVNIDPERPALPISHPRHLSMYLAKLLGPFATLGLAEDTWARNAGVLDDAHFLEQVYAIHDERKLVFLEMLARNRAGLCVCVFDAPDRVQHMFTRAPGPSGAAAGDGHAVIDDMYVRMDALVGHVCSRLRPRDVLLIVSDHGFSSFRRGVNLSVWLRENGYLAAGAGNPQADYLRSVDWSRTCAYSFGLSGIYLNRQGREAAGIVAASEVDGLKQELAARLMALRDPVTGECPIHAVHDAARVYTGPYRGDGPDLIVGFAAGYRASWEAAVGRTDGPLFSDNLRPWQGDHCVDSSLVPGVFFANRSLTVDRPLRLVDIAPTVLRLFGVPVPAYMDGTPADLMRTDQGDVS